MEIVSESIINSMKLKQHVDSFNIIQINYEKQIVKNNLCFKRKIKYALLHDISSYKLLQ